MQINLFQQELEQALNSTAPQKELLSLRERSTRQGLDLDVCLAELVEERILQDEPILDLLKQLETIEPGEVHSFLIAWAAFNTGDTNTCLEYCLKPQNPSADSLALAGQVLLENGKIDAALTYLGQAAKMDPDHELAWFFIAKGELARNHAVAAWNACTHCNTIVPNNPELALLSAMVALNEPSRLEWLKIASKRLWPITEEFPHNPETVAYQILLGQAQESRDEVVSVLEKADWKSLQEDPTLLTHTGTILREFQRCQWFDLASCFLGLVTQQDRAVTDA